MEIATKCIKEQSHGHEEMWKCTIEEFVDLILSTLLEAQREHNINSKIIKTAIGIIRARFDNGTLAGTIRYEVSKAIEDSKEYHSNK